MDYSAKIKKLLSLADSPNPNEARAAMLKAKELMAKHKLENTATPTAEACVESRATGITCTKRKNSWVMALAAQIGENYCCKAYQQRERGKQTYETAFLGFPDDLAVCMQVFQYAVDCILADIKRIRKKNASRHTAAELSQICDGYGFGFVEGIKEAFQEQKEREEVGWGLALVTPKEVEETFRNIIGRKIKTAPSVHPLAYAKGMRHGKEFSIDRKLGKKE